MTARRSAPRPKPKARNRADDTAPRPARTTPRPADVVEGIPDRSAGSGIWRYAVVAVTFLAWAAFLVYCAAAGNL